MKRQLAVFSEGYMAALSEHLRSRHAAPHLPRSLGRQAVALGIETLTLARIHQAAFSALTSRFHRKEDIDRANLFFLDALSPIEATARATQVAQARVNRLYQQLGRRTAALAKSNRSLKEGIARRRKAEKALRKSGAKYRRLLRESRRLQQSFRALACGLVAAQKNRRRKVSQQLMDEVAHDLFVVNTGLLAARKAAGQHERQLQREISMTRQLVASSVKSIEGFAREHCQ